jgi:deazaflavin-dependent oxidoreductase (nitroreductase family)
LPPLNRVFVALQRVGLGVPGITMLIVTGRRSGKPRTTPVTPFTFEGRRYIVGGFPGADWVANARAAGVGTLLTGRRRERVSLTELSPAAARPVLRVFPVEVPTGLEMMVKSGVVADDTPEAFAALAGRCAVFRLDPLPCQEDAETIRPLPRREARVASRARSTSHGH